MEIAITREGVAPPDPPTNVSAHLTEDGLMVTWDPVPTVPDSFELARGIGSYPLNVDTIPHPTPGETGMYR